MSSRLNGTLVILATFAAESNIRNEIATIKKLAFLVKSLDK